ncbi:MAG: hypothetical protein R3E64_04200 [Halioglobus sp.]
MSNWTERLKEVCDSISQRNVATILRQPDGFPSPTVINQVLNDSYPSDRGRARLQSLVNKHLANDEWVEVFRQEKVSRANAAEQVTPQWIQVLRAECDGTSQSKVATALRQRDGFPSPTVINQVLNDSYPSERGRDRLQMLIAGRYMGVKVCCPVQGDIGLDECADWQSQPFTTANPVRVEMFRACRKCPHRREEQ